MKIIGVIPARYNSSRLPGKPLLNIFGKPMIWWVYQQCKKVSKFDRVYVATDDERIKKCCEEYNIPVIMTSNEHITHVDRVHEFSEKIDSNLYVVVCGDEPLIEPEVIEKVIPSNYDSSKFYVSGLCRYINEASEVIDPGNIKVVTNMDDECILLSRTPVPFPYKTTMFKYKKVVGVECYSKSSLDFFVNTKKGFLEKIEDVTLQRFLENKIHIKYNLVDSCSLSVDTERDLEKVKDIMSKKYDL